MNEYLRRNIFLSIGLSAGSLIEDLGPDLRHLIYSWYPNNKAKRIKPFGFAFLKDCSITEKDKLLSYGIVPWIIKDYDTIPINIIKISQYASSKYTFHN